MNKTATKPFHFRGRRPTFHGESYESISDNVGNASSSMLNASGFNAKRAANP